MGSGELLDTYELNWHACVADVWGMFVCCAGWWGTGALPSGRGIDTWLQLLGICKWVFGF